MERRQDWTMMAGMIRRLSAAMVASCLLFASCGGGDDDNTASSTAPTSVTILAETSSTSTSTTSTSTTTTSTTTTSTTTSTTVPAPPTTAADPSVDELLLSGEGIGTAGFGADADGTIEYISSALEFEPDNDTGWIDPLTIGLCPGEELRRVSWGVLTLLFGDVSDVVQGSRHFFGYSYGDQGEIGAEPVGLQTTRGVTIGSRVIDVTAAYPAAVYHPEDDFSPPRFDVNDSLRGFLTGTEDDATVTAIIAGDDCGI